METAEWPASLLAGAGRSWVMESFSIAQRACAEAIGTALLVFIGAGSVPAILLLEGGTKAPFSGADLGFISMAFGLIVIAMVYTVGKVSGCHINPAVTFGLAVTKRFPWRDVPLYWGAQLVGGIAGAFAMWASFGTRAVDLGYGFGVVHFDHSTTTWGSAMFIEALGTAILLCVHNWTQQLLAYIPGNLIGAAAACLAYDWLATPRKVLAPIKAAVTEPDRADLGAPVPTQ